MGQRDFRDHPGAYLYGHLHLDRFHKLRVVRDEFPIAFWETRLADIGSRQ